MEFLNSKKNFLFIVILFLAGNILTGYSQDQQGKTRHMAFNERTEERRKLIYREVANSPGIHINNQKVLEVMLKVPRHSFVPPEMAEFAYQNTPLPIGYDQTISQPLIVASMTDLLKVNTRDKILEVGTGSGYQAAVLAEMGAEVYSIEIVPELAERASKVLRELGYVQVHVKSGDGYDGWPENAPFDKIIVTCAPEDVPAPLIQQLKPEGFIVIPVGKEDRIQYLLVLKKMKNGKLKKDYKYPVRFVPMTGKALEKDNNWP